MTRKCHNHRPQTNPKHQKEETQNTIHLSQMENPILIKGYSRKKDLGGGGGGSGVKFPIRSLALAKLRDQHVKCILSFREDETKVKIQMFDLFRRKADVYIRQLQVRMLISPINSPTPQRLVRGASSGLRGCRQPRSSKIGRRIQTLTITFLLTLMPVFGPNLLSKLNVTARHWIVLRKEDGVVVVVGGWWGGNKTIC